MVGGRGENKLSTVLVSLLGAIPESINNELQQRKKQRGESPSVELPNWRAGLERNTLKREEKHQSSPELGKLQANSKQEICTER